MGKHLNKFGVLCLGVVAWTLLFGVILSPVASAFTASDLATGWSWWHEDGAVLMTWERPSGTEANRILGYEIWRNFGLRDIVLRNDDEFSSGYDIDASEPAGIEVVDLEIDQITGSFSFSREFISWLPDEEGNPTWEEFFNDNSDLLGTDLTDISVHFGWVPSGPSIGQLQIYRIRPIILAQDRYGLWHIELGEFTNPATNQVVPVGPPIPPDAEDGAQVQVDGTLATFNFDTTYGTDEAILQVARDPGVDESIVSYFLPERTLNQVVNGFNPNGASLTIAVDLSGVPGTSNVFRWRVGSRNRQSTNRARPWPPTSGYMIGSTADPNYGWVWSDSQYLAVAVAFSDVPIGFWAFSEIEALSQADIVLGFPDGTYQPANPVTRDAMAVYIARAMAGDEDNIPTPTGPPSFADVTSDNWAYKHIEYLKRHQVVTGFPDGTYQPLTPVTRDQIAVYIARAKGWVNLDDDMTTAPALFPDVPAGFWAGTAIEACVGNGVTLGYPDGYYYPESTVTRDQMAVFVYRAFFGVDSPAP